MLLTEEDQRKAVKNGFRKDLIETWDGGPYVQDLKLFIAPKGKLRIQRFKTISDLASRLQVLGRDYNLSSHCLLVLQQAGVKLSPQQEQRAEVRSRKKSNSKKKK